VHVAKKSAPGRPTAGVSVIKATSMPSLV